jgi:hypothetical protein
MPQLAGSQPQLAVVVVNRQLDPLDRSRHRPPCGPVEVLSDPGIRAFVCAEERPHLGITIRLPDLGHADDGQHHPFGITKGQGVTLGQPLRHLVRNIERNRQRPQRAAGEVHPRTYRLVISRPHESLERGVAAVDQELQVAQPARPDINRRPITRLLPNLCDAFLVNQEIDEATAMR